MIFYFTDDFVRDLYKTNSGSRCRLYGVRLTGQIKSSFDVNKFGKMENSRKMKRFVRLSETMTPILKISIMADVWTL